MTSRRRSGLTSELATSTARRLEAQRLVLVDTPIANGIDRVSELMNDRDDRDVGLNLQLHSNRDRSGYRL
ncbi:MAG: hypothetical protein E6I37_09935 [Chloroflexi bacterium]|nr:MAG: hypothetical protein E6I53_01805 [Chloroflexota bacterium]TMF11247.1 MAG: hypothetical protein E6I37_09935 [Chloroflexota bacterium]